jgi:hypothetical protein
MLTTTRVGIPYPEGTDANDVPSFMAAMAAQIDSLMAIDKQGNVASRPTAATAPGWMWTDTGSGVTSRSDGTTWRAFARDDRVVHTTGGDVITASASSIVPLSLRGAAGQATSLLEARNSAGALLAFLDPNGGFTAVGGVQSFVSAPGFAAFRGVATDTQTAPLIQLTGGSNSTANAFEFRPFGSTSPNAPAYLGNDAVWRAAGFRVGSYDVLTGFTGVMAIRKGNGWPAARPLPNGVGCIIWLGNTDPGVISDATADIWVNTPA